MIGTILNCLLNEAQALFEGTGAQLMLKTNFLPKDTPDNNGHLLLLGLNDAPDSLQFPGGLTMMDWDWGFDTYTYEPDAYHDDPTSYSADLLSFNDKVRRHFSLGSLGNGLVFQDMTLRPNIVYIVMNGSITYNEQTITDQTYFISTVDNLNFTSTNGGYVVGTSWLTQGMVDIFNLFGFQLTFKGITTADPLDQTGIIMGYKILFASTALDDKTLYTQEDVILNTITQLNEDQNVIAITMINRAIDIPQDAVLFIPPDTLFDGIGILPTSGNPIISMGFEVGGTEILDNFPLIQFRLVELQQYFEIGTNIFVTLTGGTVSADIRGIFNYLVPQGED